MTTLRCASCKDIIGFADDSHAIDQFIVLLCQPCAKKGMKGNYPSVYR